MKRLQFIVLSLIITLFSCHDDSIDKAGFGSEVVFQPRFGTDYSLQGGILKFTSLDTYLSTIAALNRKTDIEKASFGKENGFNSFYSKFFENFNKVVKFEQEADRLNAVDPKYVVLQDGFPHINMGSSSVSTVVNTDGLVYIGKTLFRFKGDQEIIVKNGNIASAMNPEIGDSTNILVLNTLVSNTVRNSRNGRLPGTCNSLKGSTGNFSAGCSIIANVYLDQYPLDYDYIKFRLVFTAKTEAESHKIFGNYGGTPTLNLSYVLNAFDQDGQTVGVLNTYRQVVNTLNYNETLVVDNVYSFLVPYYSVQFQKNSIYGNGSVVNPSLLRFTEFIIGSCGVSADCYN